MLFFYRISIDSIEISASMKSALVAESFMFPLGMFRFFCLATTVTIYINPRKVGEKE